MNISELLKLIDVNRLNFCYIVLSFLVIILTVIAIIYEKFNSVSQRQISKIELKELNIKTKGFFCYFFQLSMIQKVDLLFPIDFIICLIVAVNLIFPYKDYFLPYVIAIMLFLYLDNVVTKFRYFFILSNNLKERQLMSFKRMGIRYIEKVFIILGLNIIPVFLSLLIVKNKGQLVLLLMVGILIILTQKDIILDNYVSLHVLKTKAQTIIYNKYLYLLEIPIIAQVGHIIGKNLFLIIVICIVPHIIYLIMKIIINFRRVAL